MNTPKKHHEIPQMLLRNSTDQNGSLYCYQKEGNKVFKTNPSNVFVQQKHYSKPSDDVQQAWRYV